MYDSVLTNYICADYSHIRSHSEKLGGVKTSTYEFQWDTSPPITTGKRLR